MNKEKGIAAVSPFRVWRFSTVTFGLKDGGTGLGTGFGGSIIFLRIFLVDVASYTHLYEIVRQQLSYMQLHNIQHAYSAIYANLVILATH